MDARAVQPWDRPGFKTPGFPGGQVWSPPGVQTFIGGKRIGGYEDLLRFFNKPVPDPKATSYKPVIAVFAMTALMALAASYAAYGTPLTMRAGE